MKCIDRLTVIRRLGTLCAILMLAASSSLAQTVQNVTLGWDPSPDASVVGYILRYGIVGGISTNSLDVANQTTGTASNLSAGTTVFFFVTAYNAQRLESLPSNLITYTVPGVNNTPPTISSIANQTIAAGRTTGPISFTVGDMDTPLSSLTLSGNSSNPTLVPSANIVFGGSGANRTVTVTPTAAQTGTATITVSVSDGSASTSKSFAVTVLPNTPPTISSIPNQVITANTATPPIPFVIGDAETPVTGLVLSRSSSNPTLVPSNNIVFGGSGTNRTVTVTPAANQSGAATVTVTLSDGTTNASKSFLLTVVNALGAPTFVYLPIEAESATIASPMAIASDPNAGQGQFIQSTNGLGAATFTVNVPLSGVYSVWCRILSPNSNQDSFYVSVDGGAEDIFDTAEGTWTNAWQWTVLNGRGGTNSASSLAINPRTFLLSAGPHNITFRGRDRGTGFDQMLLTNDRDFVPNAIYSSAAPPFRISSIAFDPAGFVTLTWPTQPGKTYRVVYKTNLANSAWLSLGKDVTATGTITSQSDYLVGNRFYGILQLP